MHFTAEEAEEFPGVADGEVTGKDTVPYQAWALEQHNNTGYCLQGGVRGQHGCCYDPKSSTNTLKLSPQKNRPSSSSSAERVVLWRAWLHFQQGKPHREQKVLSPFLLFSFLSLSLLFCFVLFVCLFLLHLWNMEVSRLGVKPELQLPAYTTVPSHSNAKS